MSCGDNEEQKEDSADLVNQILASIVKKHSDYLAEVNLNKKVAAGLVEYIINCCHVCWVMVLQDPSLNIKPSMFQPMRHQMAVYDPMR
eukprot:797248_1